VFSPCIFLFSLRTLAKAPSDIMEKKKNILLIDHKVVHPFLLQRIISDEGYVCHLASTIQQTLFMAHEMTYHLLLLNLSFPEIMGLDVLRIIKIDPVSKDIPVLALSGWEAWERAYEALREGASDYITHPFNIQDLLNKIGLLCH